MSNLNKELNRLKSKPKDFTYDEAKRILNNLGFSEDNKGKTSGSRVVFYNHEINKKLNYTSHILRKY